MALSDEMKAQFVRDGYFVMPAIFSADEVARMRVEADSILELIINSSLCHQRHSRRLDIRKCETGGLIARKVQPIIDLSLYLAEISRDDRLLAPMAELMADEPVLMEEKLNYKQPVPDMDVFTVPEDDDRFPAHNDWAYYKMNGYPKNIISSAITIDETTEGNGPLIVFPGTHHSHVEHDQVRNGLQAPKGSFDAASGVPILAPPGSVLLFHSLLIHTSGPNRSGDSRRVMIFSHYPKAANMGADARNGPNRLREAPWEWEYQRKKEAGLFQDQFFVS